MLMKLDSALEGVPPGSMRNCCGHAAVLAAIAAVLDGGIEGTLAAQHTTQI
jgi:hypothetical protein